MKKFLGIVVGIIVIGGFAYTLFYLYQKNQQAPIEYSTAKAFYTDIQKKSVATGSIIPREEVDIKPQVSGIIQEIFVVAGDIIKAGDLIARIKIIPNMLSLNNAQNRISQAKIQLKNSKADFERNKKLFKDKIIAEREFQQFELNFESSKQELDAAIENLQIVQDGASNKSGKSSLTLVKATVDGMVLDVPIKVGNQVIESNNFNDGTTVATIADMSNLVFEGKIDESEVGKIKEGMEITLSVGAIENKTFDATLEYIAPKGVEENGAIQFLIKAKVIMDSTAFIRAGYSANADIVLESRKAVLSLKESLIQYEKGKPFVEVENGEQIFEKKEVQLGLSDGINVELISGIDSVAKVKVWNGVK